MCQLIPSSATSKCSLNGSLNCDYLLHQQQEIQPCKYHIIPKNLWDKDDINNIINNNDLTLESLAIELLVKIFNSINKKFITNIELNKLLINNKNY